MLIKIKNRFDDSVIYKAEHNSLREACEEMARLGKSLSRANLYGADLYGANLSGTNLSRADLSRADLSRANLSRANLYGADLYGADLYGANLYGTNLSRADLSRANLSGTKDAEYAIAQTRILPEGSIIGWKKVMVGNVGTGIVKLHIPEEAKRSHAFGRKCRCEFAVVIEAPEGAYTSKHGPRTEYKVGEVVKPDKWDDNWQEECSHGIHFFITRIEAEND